ncbi:SDR family NAD(P)-dependent oxidoreductase [uncultured Halopseudomonas sp.]|uniref:SDR family NAD(P)-dependent oxidoreductase n=1 Tax=uncultured Halopseudomonas sp. TaxID=2901193 RepID=UPI0030EF2B13|tara:strand:- start:8231 stop:8989 length:759 start_codon:yes stop_codon:yes gene_type:complete
MDSQSQVGTKRSVLIAGASRGIGHALVEALLQRDDFDCVFAVARSWEGCSLPSDSRLYLLSADLTDDSERDAMAATVSEHCNQLDLVINTVGFLHEPGGQQPEKSLRQLNMTALQRSFSINAAVPVLLAQALMPLLRGHRHCVFASLSARVGSIGDNRLGGWYAYRASKAAQNMLMRTFAVEWTRLNRESICLLLHPGTTDTDLSAPFQANVPEGKLFTTQFVAERLLAVIGERSAADTGNFYAWDGEPIPW